MLELLLGGYVLSECYFTLIVLDFPGLPRGWNTSSAVSPSLPSLQAEQEEFLLKLLSNLDGVVVKGPHPA